MNLTRAKFEKLCKEIFDKFKKPLDVAIRFSKLPTNKIDEVILVGGSTRIPKIEMIMRQYFSHLQSISKVLNPDEAVAKGAAVYAGKKAGVSRLQ